ncbi:Uncharacterised protein [Mycobacteroides abscessus subsp. abscessus]|nr:Uncharacterised protein [Mycobacteroides abscessus subsp. abscessus]
MKHLAGYIEVQAGLSEHQLRKIGHQLASQLPKEGFCARFDKQYAGHAGIVLDHLNQGLDRSVSEFLRSNRVVRNGAGYHRLEGGGDLGKYRAQECVSVAKLLVEVPARHS